MQRCRSLPSSRDGSGDRTDNPPPASPRARLHLRDSQVFGGDAEASIFGGPAGEGGHAVFASSGTSEVVLAGTTLTGGNGGDAFGFASPIGCLMGAPGPGGSAVVASNLWSWGSVGTGGPGGSRWDCGPVLVGTAPPGARHASPAPADLALGSSAPLGGSATFALVNPSGRFGAIAASTTGFSSPVPLPGLGPYFLGPAPVVFAAGLGLLGANVSIPPTPALLGVAVPVQGLIGAALTNPGSVLVVP